MSDPQSVDEWLKLANRHSDGARTLLAAKQFELAWENSGFAVECALKAAIMRSERLNAWPERSSRPDLHVHDITKLAERAGLNLPDLAADPIYPAWLVVRMWRRGDSYNPNDKPRKIAEDMVEAACGAMGVIKWIEVRFHLN